MKIPKNEKYKRIGNEIHSNIGFKVRFGHEHLSYIEDDKHALELDAYFLMNPKIYKIYIKNACWQWFPPYTDEEITQAKKEEILQRINEALSSANIIYEFV